MEISIYAIIIWITAVFIISLATVTIIGGKNLSSRIFSFLCLLTAIWVASQGFFISSSNEVFVNFLVRLQHLLCISIAIGFYLFSITYPYNKKIHRKILILIECDIINKILIMAKFYFVFIIHPRNIQDI